MKNPFGNYVVQKALKLSSGYYKGKLTGIIKKHIEKLNDRKLINKWKEILANVTGNKLSLAHLDINKLSPTNSISPNNSFISSNSPHSPNSFHSTNSGGAMQSPILMNKYVFHNKCNNLSNLHIHGNMCNVSGNLGGFGEVYNVNSQNWSM